MNYKEFVNALVKRKKLPLLVSLFSVFFLSLFSYILNNQALFTGEDLNKFAWMQMLKNKLGIENQVSKDNVLFVNIAFDKQLIELRDEYGMPIGNTDITDRKKLLDFLQMLDSTKQYAYIFLDVFFEKDYNAPEVDSLLFAKIRKMNNIVIANHSNTELAEDQLLEKSAISDFFSTLLTTNFVRYVYSMGDNKPSMPLFAFSELTQKTINKHWFIYTCNGRLCYNSLFVEFPIEEFNEFNSENHKTFYNLGSDLLDNYSERDIGILTKDKYVVIGDMINELHDTYSGKKPGSVITYYSFNALMKEKHLVNYWLLLLMAIVYFVISFSQFNQQSVIERMPYIAKSNFLRFIMSLVGYSILLGAIVILLNLCFDISTSIILPSVYFAIQKNIINYKRSKV